MLGLTLPIDYNLIRKAIVGAVTQFTRLVCIEEMPETQGATRPPKPYFSYRMVTPGGKQGDDSSSPVLDNLGAPTTVWNVGGPRKMTVDFNTYAVNKDDSYNYMAQWQQALETETVQEILRRAGIAVWLNGSVADVSTLLQTGFEGRAHMTVAFGISLNTQEDRSEIAEVKTTGTVTDDGGQPVGGLTPIDQS